MERAELASYLGNPLPARTNRTVVAESDPRRFMAAFAAAVAGGGDVFLANPAWGDRERAQLEALLAANPPSYQAERGWLMIPTGGSSGAIRFARHDQHTIAAAVDGFKNHFRVGHAHALGLLPLHHVSGFMAWMRCALSEGEYLPAVWKSVEAGNWPELPERPGGWVVSLVPTQLERIMRDDRGIERLRQFRCIFLGGAPAWNTLLDEAAETGLRISTGYGMTETAAMATGLHPEEFHAGNRNNGRALPHVHVRIADDGRIMLAGESLFRGYFPDWRTEGEFATEDAGLLDGNGYLTVLGRLDGVVISGGEKVRPEEVEAVLRSTEQFTDVTVLGVPDEEWGQMLVAAYASGAEPDWILVQGRLERDLSAYKRPKRFLQITPWPRNQQGKVNRLELSEAVSARLQTRQEDLPE